MASIWLQQKDSSDNNVCCPFVGI